ncbi:MAG: anaerobic magnesium-protoporphyrin IX monomethyl ester cyclase [Myxococcota bacterium]|jgi:anaerobic magnesium-protoporphyrin IX monomethyl ester cyclase
MNLGKVLNSNMSLTHTGEFQCSTIHQIEGYTNKYSHSIVSDSRSLDATAHVLSHRNLCRQGGFVQTTSPKRVLLVQSYLGRKGVSDQLVYPIGLSCIATALDAAGHIPWIVDLNVGGEPYERLEREIQRFKPDVIGVSQRNIDSTTRKAPFVYHTQLRPTLRTIRQHAPHAVTVIGGPGFTQSSDAFFERYDFDFGVKSEGEETIVSLLENLSTPHKVRGVYYRGEGGRPVFTGDASMPTFETLPYPKRHFIDWELYRQEERARHLFLDIGIESTRGCPRKCAYCNYPMLNGVKLRRKPPAVVVDEIEYLQRTFNIPQFTFTDSRFNENSRHARAVCEEIIRRGVKIRWVAWLGFRRISSEFLSLMRDAGCYRVAFSPDGLLQPSLNRMRKELRTQEIFDSIKAVQKVPGLKSSWSFFATPPSTSNREQLAMLGMYAYIHGSMPGRGRMMLNWCRVEEHTHFEKIAREDGVLPAGIDLLPEDPVALDATFYEPPGFQRWSRFWNRFLDAELAARFAAGRIAAPLRRSGLKVRDITPDHMKGMANEHKGLADAVR